MLIERSSCVCCIYIRILYYRRRYQPTTKCRPWNKCTSECDPPSRPRRRHHRRCSRAHCAYINSTRDRHVFYAVPPSSPPLGRKTLVRDSEGSRRMIGFFGRDKKKSLIAIFLFSFGFFFPHIHLLWTSVKLQDCIRQKWFKTVRCNWLPPILCSGRKGILKQFSPYAIDVTDVCGIHTRARARTYIYIYILYLVYLIRHSEVKDINGLPYSVDKKKKTSSYERDFNSDSHRNRY